MLTANQLPTLSMSDLNDALCLNERITVMFQYLVQRLPRGIEALIFAQEGLTF